MQTQEITITRRLLTKDRQDFVAVVTLNRPEVANAFNAEMVQGLLGAWEELAAEPQCRALVLSAAGKHFSAGADLVWMRSSVALNFGENLAEAKLLAAMFEGLYRFPRPTIAVVHGAAYGGAVGLASCCDVVIAARESKFCLSEVKLGILPAVIFPYLARRLTPGALRRYSLTARVFSGDEACRIGLVDVCSSEDEMNASLRQELADVLAASPDGQQATKRLHQWLVDHSLSASEKTVEAIAKARTGEAGQQGLHAFLNKTTPSWKVDLPKDWTL